MRTPQSTIPNPYIDKILRGDNPTAGDFVQTPQGNPFAGLNLPGMIGQSRGQQQGNSPQGGGVFNKIDGFLGKPGGMMLMNLLAQQGYSKMPQSRIGAVGRAALMTQNQQAAQTKAKAEADLMAAQGKYYNAKAGAEGLGVAGNPLTAVGKAGADLRAGVITQDQYDKIVAAEVNKNARNVFTDTNTARGQYRTDVSGPRASLSGLAAAEGLLSVNNAIGDTAAFTSFIRSIDNSVVRPAEQEAYNRALGIRNTIEATVQQWAGKGPLPPKTKKALLDSIRKLRGIMEGIVDRTTEYYNKEADKYGLDPESVTGLPVKFDEVDVPITVPTDPSGSSDDPELTEIDAEIAEIDRQLGTR